MMKKSSFFSPIFNVNVVFILSLFFALSILGGCMSIDSSSEQLQYEIWGLGYERNIESYHAIVELHKQGKKSIPLLIDEIDNCQPLTDLTFAHPRNSIIWGTYNCYGFLYAYLVELILAKEKIETHSSQFYKILGSDDNFIFFNGVLSKNNACVARKEDLPEIKNAYRAWWEKNKWKSLAELRENWKHEKRPLTGSRFGWN
jgi:hypothetical protein